jgi:hypothetical protein
MPFFGGLVSLLTGMECEYSGFTFLSQDFQILVLGEVQFTPKFVSNLAYNP